MSASAAPTEFEPLPGTPLTPEEHPRVRQHRREHTAMSDVLAQATLKRDQLVTEREEINGKTVDFLKRLGTVTEAEIKKRRDELDAEVTAASEHVMELERRLAEFDLNGKHVVNAVAFELREQLRKDVGATLTRMDAAMREFEAGAAHLDELHKYLPKAPLPKAHRILCSVIPQWRLEAINFGAKTTMKPGKQPPQKGGRKEHEA